MKKKIIVLLICLAMVFLYIRSCKTEADRFKKMPQNRVLEIRTAMETVVNLLKRSTFDTTSIINSSINTALEREIGIHESTQQTIESVEKTLHPSKGYTKRKINFDSVKLAVSNDLDTSVCLLLLSKQIVMYPDGSISLNRNQISRKLESLESDIYKCKELKNLTDTEKAKLARSFQTLVNYNIWGAYQLSKDSEVYYFDMAHDIIYDTYLNRYTLFLESDYQQIKMDQGFSFDHILLYEKDGIFVYGAKR